MGSFCVLFRQHLPEFEQQEMGDDPDGDADQVDQGVLPSAEAAGERLVDLIEDRIEIAEAGGPGEVSSDACEGIAQAEAQGGKQDNVGQFTERQAEEDALVGNPGGFLDLLHLQDAGKSVAEVLRGAGGLGGEVKDDRHHQQGGKAPEDAPSGCHPLRVRLPQAVEVAVFVGRDDGIGDGEFRFGFVAGFQVLLLVAAGGFQQDPFDPVDVQHGMGDGADLDGDVVAVLFDDGNVLFMGAVGGIGGQFLLEADLFIGDEDLVFGFVEVHNWLPPV